MSADPPSGVMARLGAYRPTLNRVLLGLSFLGILVVVHLYIQQGRGFDRGCLGFSAPQAVEATFNCSAVVNSGAGTFAGISNVWWGLGFYSAVALLTFGHLASTMARRWWSAARAAVLTGGMLYSAYLVHVQVNVLQELCALCLTSAGVATLLFVIQGAALVFPSRTTKSMTPRSRKRETAVFAALFALVVVLAGADLTYFASLPAPASTAQQAALASSDPSACRLDTQKGAVEDWPSLINMQDPMTGASDAEVTIIEYFDPNCPHCADFHDTIEALQAEYGASVRFVHKPFPLRASSLPEIEALYAAAQEGKFSAMVKAQFERQGPGGITERDLRTIAEEIGMDPDALMSRVQSQTYRTLILRDRQRAMEIGVSSTPTVLVNGHFVASRSEECMRTFIEEAMNGTLADRG